MPKIKAKHRIIAAAGASIVAFAASPASAKAPVNEFSDCLVRANPGRMQEWVNFDGPGLIYKDIAAVSTQTNCASSVTFDYWDLRGALAEALVRPKLNELPDFTSAPPLTDIEMALRWGNNDGRRSMLLNVFSECAVRQFPRDVVNLFQSEAGSKAERKSLTALKDVSAPCQSIAGDIELPERSATLRGRVAIALNQMLQARAASQASAH